MPLLAHLTLILLAALAVLAPVRAAAQAEPGDPRLACDRAAARAERGWNLPVGLLAAIGTVESGRPDPSGPHRRAWPWSINAEGWSHYAASRTAAVSTVHALQGRGIRSIDVGCFQVNLLHHPRAFASLDAAFDPETNAQAAARILALARMGSTGWERAIATYHSASLLRGTLYLQRVLAVWPAARARLAVLEAAPDPSAAYAVLLSPEAQRVRVVTSTDPAPPAGAGLPRVISPFEVPAQTRLTEATQTLPRVLSPPDAGRRRL